MFKEDVYLDLFHPKDSNILNYHEFQCFLKKKGLRKGLFTGYFMQVSSFEEKLPIPKKIDEEEKELKYLLSMYGMDIFGQSEKELPNYLINKIKYARRGGNLANLHYTMKEISDINHYKDYIGLYKEDEIYNELNNFFEEVYKKIIELNITTRLKLDVKDKIDNYLFKNKDVVFCSRNILTLMSPILKKLSEDTVVIDKLKYIINKFGSPYIMFKESNFFKDYYMCNLDYFMTIGILLTIQKKLNYKIINSTEEIMNLFNFQDLICNEKNNNDYKIYLKDIIELLSHDIYIKLICTTVNTTYIEKIELEFETKKAMLYTNLSDFYYKYFNNYIETDKFKKSLEQEEVEKIRLWFKKDYEKKIKKTPEKKEYYNKLIKDLWIKDDNTIRRQFKNRKNRTN